MTGRSLLAVLDVAYVASLLTAGGLLGLVAWRQGRGNAAGARSAAVLGVSAGAVALASFASGALVVPELRGPHAASQMLLQLALIVSFLSLAHRGEKSERRGGSWGRIATPALILLMLLVGLVVRPRPVTSGLVELSPEERAARRFGSAGSSVPAPPAAEAGGDESRR